MANENSPYYGYDPESLGWLHRRDEDGSEILSADIVRIIKANPELVTDVILRDYVVRGLEAGLKAKRGPKATISQLARNYATVDLYNYWLPLIEKRKHRERSRGARRARSDMSSTELAQAIVARRMGFKSPDSVRNLLSSLRMSKK